MIKNICSEFVIPQPEIILGGRFAYYTDTKKIHLICGSKPLGESIKGKIKWYKK